MPNRLDGVTIYRDTYGVPHIYGDTEEAALFGQGYAMAEDRLQTLLKAYLKAAGRTAEVFGPDWVEHDLQQRIARHLEISRDNYASLGEPARAAVEAFLAGVKRYMADHPDQVPAWAPEIHPYHVIALSRYAIWSWPVRQAVAKLEAAKKALDTGQGSNSWVIGRERSAENCAIGLIDPHVRWQDEWLFYEAHLHGGDLSVFGFNVPGAPYVAIGHNEFLYWTCTTGGPDCSDVYIEEMNPHNPLQYRYDGAWRDCEVQRVELKVKTDAGTQTIVRNVPWTCHGPIVESAGGKGFAFKLSYFREFRLVEQFAAMTKARDLEEFLRAMRMLQLMPQNVMYADVHGDMYYVRNGRTPIRPEGFDFRKPVPGWTSASEWLGIHKYEDLVQIKNPPAGFLQNCNTSPGTVTFHSPLTPDKQPYYLYNDSAHGINPRGERFLALMENPRKITREEALAIATDVSFHRAGVYKKAILAAYANGGPDSPDLQEAVGILRDWDGRASADSCGMTLFRTWWHILRRQDESLLQTVLEGGQSPAVLRSLHLAVRYLREKFGRIRVPWGEVFRLQRGERSWPVSGAAEAGLVTLRSVGGPEPNEKGITYAWWGQTSLAVVFLGRPVTSFSAVPYGQSERPDSPHFCDQAEKLFAKAQLKPTWHPKADLMAHVASETKLKLG